jgi:hypothetical protein
VYTHSPEIVLTPDTTKLPWFYDVNVSTPPNVNFDLYKSNSTLYTWSPTDNISPKDTLYDTLSRVEYHRLFPYGEYKRPPITYKWPYLIIRFFWRCLVPLGDYGTPYRTFRAMWEEFIVRKRSFALRKLHAYKRNPQPPRPPTGEQPYLSHEVNFTSLCTPHTVYSLFRDLSGTNLHVASMKGRVKKKHQYAQDYETRPLVFLDPSFGITSFAERPLANYETLELLTFLFIFLASVLYIFSVLRLYFIAMDT